MPLQVGDTLVGWVNETIARQIHQVTFHTVPPRPLKSDPSPSSPHRRPSATPELRPLPAVSDTAVERNRAPPKSAAAAAAAAAATAAAPPPRAGEPCAGRATPRDRVNVTDSA